MTVPSNNATISVEKEKKKGEAYEPKTKKKVVGPIIKPVTACMRQRVYWLWGRFLFRGASDLYDRDLLCDGSGSHGRVKGNQKEFVPEDGQILKRQRSHLPQGRVSLIF